MTTTRIFTPLVLVAATLQCARVAAQTTTTPVPVERIAEVVTNAPVAPEAIYIGRRGGLSVIDLNGFGQGTGSIAHLRDPQQPFGFKRNPNIGRPGLLPQVRLGTSNRDAGSSGALTLTTDSSMKTLLGDLTSADAIAVGQPLDLVYNNENINRNAISAMQVNPWSD
ncbi:MAG TPA: hypothetical protein PKE00_01665 [Planctomycetota bacterium]|nr:hypothetical protein [Planctomycetota bacterium]